MVDARNALAVVVLGGTTPDITEFAPWTVLDLIEIESPPAMTARTRRFSGGRLTEDVTLTWASGDPRLAAVEVSLFLEARDDGPPLDLVVLVSGEKMPQLEAMILGLINSPYLLVAESPIYQSSRLQALTGAGAILIERQHADEWAEKHIVPAVTYQGRWWRSDEWRSTVTRISRNSRDSVWPLYAEDNGLLVVSYFSPPTTPVSVQRLAYWHAQIPQIASELFDCELPVTWLTATAGAAGRQGFAVVPDRGPWQMSDSWYQRYRALDDLGVSSLGLSWGYWVENEARRLSGRYSSVVISGNPFFYFDLITPFKEMWDATVVLDFRDPFAGNPRFNYTPEQRDYLRHLENDWVAGADVVVSVNDHCLNVIAPDVSTRRVVVANGFDEAVVDSARKRRDATEESVVRIAYSGTVFPNLPLNNVVSALDPSRHRLVHFGRDYSASASLGQSDLAEQRGLVEYGALIPELMLCDAGIVMTSGEPSTQTSKLFDYIACDLDIIIVTQGDLRTGNLHEVTKELDRVFWVRDEFEELERFFADYEPGRGARVQRDLYSRRAQTERLLEAIGSAESEPR